MIDFTKDSKFDKWDEKLQSPVVSYNLTKPMTMIGFMSLPDHAQKEYLQLLRKDYGGRREGIADMFGVDIKTVSELFKRFGLSLNTGRYGAKQRAAWAKFIEGYEMPDGPIEPQNPTETKSPKEAPLHTRSLPVQQAAAVQPVHSNKADVPVLQSFCALLTGPIDRVLKKLEAFSGLVGDLPVQITITVNEEDEDVSEN